MYKKNRQNIRFAVVILMMIVVMFALVTSCSSKKIKFSKKNDDELEYTYKTDKFIFRSSDEDEQTLEIVKNCVDFYEKIKVKYNKLNFNNITYSVGDIFLQNENTIVSPKKLNKYISYEELYLAGKMIFKDDNTDNYKSYPDWLRYGLSHYLYVDYTEDTSKKKYGEYFHNKESVKRYITSNIESEKYLLTESDFSQLNEEFQINKELSANFVAFLIKEVSEEVFFDTIENYKYFEEIFGYSIEELLCMWLKDLGIDAKYLSGGFVFLLESDEYHLVAEGYDKMVVSNKIHYYVSSNYLSEEEIFDFFSKYISDIENLKKYFTDNDFNVVTREINYKIIGDDQVVGENRQYLFLEGIKEKKSLYISNFIDNHIASPVSPWLKTGMQGFLEKRYNRFTTFLDVGVPTAKELLDDNNIHYLLTFDKDYFLKGAIILEQTENATTLATDFVEFLESHIGTKKLVELYTNEYDLEKITELTEEVLKEKWLLSLGVDKSILTDINYQDKNNQDENIDVAIVEKIIQKTTFGYIYESVDVRYFFPENYLSYVEMWEFIELCEQSIEDIKAYLGHKFLPLEDKLEISVSDEEGASYSYGNRMIIYYVKDKKAEYTHEIVHLLTGFDNEIWISEGLATYLDSMFSKWITPPLYGQDLDSKAKDVLAAGGKEGIIDFNNYFFTAEATPSEHMDAYILAASFVKYIENEYSRKILLEMFNDISKTKVLTGYSVDELKNSWLTSLV